METLSEEAIEEETLRTLEVLREAVAEALERKRRLGQYAVILHEGRIVKLMPDGEMIEIKE